MRVNSVSLIEASQGVRGEDMEYLLEVHWVDPVADAVARLLSSLPEGVELTTGQAPQGRGRAFGVYRSDSFDVLEGLARAVSSLGAQVQITSIAGLALKLIP